MARGPDASGAGTGFSLKDQLFNAETIGDLAAEHAVIPGFDVARFQKDTLSRFPELGLLQRLEWMADCLEAQLPKEFPAMADALEAAMPDALDPSLTDNDFGRFIHAVPGILAVRHGAEDHRDRALDLLHKATQRFSMEFYIRPFLNRWPEATLDRLRDWMRDDNYHVRRLVSEGTRPKLPWARNITLDPKVPLEFLDVLHADSTRYVTRSVANHMNDISKLAPDAAIAHLQAWQKQAAQTKPELAWLTKHALRTAVKRGEPAALRLLGYRDDVSVDATLDILTPVAKMGDALKFAVTLTTQSDEPLMVDYRLHFARPGGKTGEKVFKLKSIKAKSGVPIKLEKRHALKADATTFRLYPGTHGVTVQVNGRDVAHAAFEVA